MPLPYRFDAALKMYPQNNSVFVPGLPIKRVKGMTRVGWRLLADKTLVLQVRRTPPSNS